ncbi:MAG: HAMP domain-containing protein [Alphaproteobacteria bacterium]|nr:HAMP domain-containing protein [Alphaproteobacteria bacterium]
MNIRTKYVLVLVSLVAGLTVAISLYHFSTNQRLSDEFRERSLERLEASLTNRARENALSLSILTASAALEPLFFEDIERVGSVLTSLLERPEVNAVLVYARDGTVFHDGSEALETFGSDAPDDVVRAMGDGERLIQIRPENMIRIVTPIAAGGYTFGALEVLIDAGFVDRQISVMQLDLASAFDREMRKQIVQLLVVSVVALLLAGLIAVFLAGRLSAPIRELADATRRIEKGDFGVDIRTRRDDELGDLARAFEHMANTLQETMVLRSELQRTVDEQTTELRAAHDNLLAQETDRREVIEEITNDLRSPITELESDAEHALRNQDSALELRHSMSRLLLRIRDVRRLLEDLRFASRSDEPRRAARRD